MVDNSDLEWKNYPKMFDPGHIMRNQRRYGLLQAKLQKNTGKQGLSRRRTSWLKKLKMWFKTTTLLVFRTATNKIMIVRMVANIRTGYAPEKEEDVAIDSLLIITQ